MLSALSLVKVGWGSERLGAFAKPNILNIKCMRKKRSNVEVLHKVHGEVHGVDHDRD